MKHEMIYITIYETCWGLGRDNKYSKQTHIEIFEIIINGQTTFHLHFLIIKRRHDHEILI